MGVTGNMVNMSAKLNTGSMMQLLRLGGGGGGRENLSVFANKELRENTKASPKTPTTITKPFEKMWVL